MSVQNDRRINDTSSHCMDKSHGDESGEGMQSMQQKTMKCWLCKEEGHKANQCPNQEKPKEQPQSKLSEAKAHWCQQLGTQILNDNTSSVSDRSVLDK